MGLLRTDDRVRVIKILREFEQFLLELLSNCGKLYRIEEQH